MQKTVIWFENEWMFVQQIAQEVIASASTKCEMVKIFKDWEVLSRSTIWISIQTEISPNEDIDSIKSTV